MTKDEFLALFHKAMTKGVKKAEFDALLAYKSKKSKKKYK